MTADYTVIGTPIGTAPVTPPGIAVPYYYTSQGEIERLFSQQGAASNVDDYMSDETPPSSDVVFQAAVWDDVCCAATDEANLYLINFHEPADLYGSRWVRTRTTWIACYYLSMRRGNPGYFKTLYEHAIDDFGKINESRPVPRLALNSSFTPALSNIRIDDRFLVAKERVEPTISTGGTSSRQHLDPSPYIGPWGP